MRWWIFVLCILPFFLSAQNLTLHGGLGLGGFIHSGDQETPPKIALHLGAGYCINDIWSLGIDFQPWGNLNPYSGNVGIDDGNKEFHEAGGGSSRLLLFQARYQLAPSKEKFRPFIGLGTGSHQMIEFIHVNQISDIRQNNWVVAPEVGIDFTIFSMALRWISPATTPEFNNTDLATGRQIIYDSGSLSMLNLYIKYHFQIKRKDS